MALLPLAMACVAFLYASVGHAGASGYIAVLALAGWSPALIKPAALVLNALVASLGCWNFLRAGHFPARRFVAVYALAVPLAFVGGWLQIPGPWFERLVGLVLWGSAWRLGQTPHDPPNLRPASVPALLSVGGGLGLLAGADRHRRWCLPHALVADGAVVHHPPGGGGVCSVHPAEFLGRAGRSAVGTAQGP